MSRKPDPRLLSRIGDLERALEAAQSKLSSLSRQLSSLPPPPEGVYLSLSPVGTLLLSPSTQTGPYSLTISPDQSGMTVIMRNLAARKISIGRLGESDACPTQSMIQDWLHANCARRAEKPPADVKF